MPSLMMNALWVQRVQSTGAQVDYFDQKEKGLGLRVGKSGAKTWFVMYRVKGSRKKKRLTLQQHPAMSLAEARQEVRSTIVQADKGIDPAAEKQVQRSAPTFRELAAEYLERHAQQQKKPKSVFEDKRILDRDLLPAFRDAKAHDVKRRDVLRLLDEIVDRGAPIMANRTLALIRKIYNWGIGRDLVEHNPCLQVEMPGKERKRDRVYTDEELRALWEMFEGMGEIGAIFKLLLATAQRPNEVMSMRWQDLDLESAWWTIPAEHAKNKLAHRVPLNGVALAILAQIKQSASDHTWVFPSPAFKCDHIGNIQKASARIKNHSGVADFCAYPLRHTAASRMTGMGIPRLVVGRILNHVEKEITTVYDRHSYDAEKRTAVDKWGTMLERILTGERAEVVKLQRIA